MVGMILCFSVVAKIKIACAGGVFGNVKANKSILQLDCIDDAFFCPAASDEGLAVGAALSGYNELELQKYQPLLAYVDKQNKITITKN